MHQSPIKQLVVRRDKHGHFDLLSRADEAVDERPVRASHPKARKFVLRDDMPPGLRRERHGDKPG